MGISAILDLSNLDEDYLRRLRSNSVRNVKNTNGLLTFEQKVREQESDSGDVQWQD